MNQISALPNPLEILFQEYNQGRIESVGFRSFTLHAGENADRLLCRLVLKAADPGGLRRHRGKNHLRSGQASVRTLQPDGEFPWNHAE